MTPPTDRAAFVVYSHGIVHASACTSLTDDAATAKMNVEYPTGIDSRWQITGEPFRTGEPNGVPCHDAPETHRHVLFTC